MPKRPALLLLVFLLLSGPAFARKKKAAPKPTPTPTPTETPTVPPTPTGDVIDLEECIRRALANWPGLEAAEFDREAVEAKLSEAKRAYILPEIKLRVLGGVVPDIPAGAGPPDFPEVHNSFSDLGPFIQTKVEAIQPLFTFGKLSGLKMAAERGVKAKEAQEEVARNEVVTRVKRAYYALEFLYSVQDFLDELAERARKARERVESELQRHSPEVTDIDVLRLDVFQRETDRRLIEIRNGIDFARASMAILTGSARTKLVDIVDRSVRFEEIPVIPIENYLERARQSRPEVRQLSAIVAARKGQLRAATADFFPFFFLGGYYNFSKAPGRSEFDNPYLSDEFNTHVGGGAVGLEQKLAFHLTDARRDEASALYNKALADERQALLGIELEIRKAHTEALGKAEAVKIAREGFKSGRGWVMATTLNFGVGTVPVKDLLESFVVYSKVRVDLLSTINDYNLALAELSRVVGQEVTNLRY